MLLMSDNKFYTSRSLLARYCDKSNGKFETLLNLVYGTLVDSRCNRAS